MVLVYTVHTAHLPYYPLATCTVHHQHSECCPMTPSQLCQVTPRTTPWWNSPPDQTSKVSRQVWACQLGAFIKLTVSPPGERVENAWAGGQGLQARSPPCCPRWGWGWGWGWGRWPPVLALLHHGWGLRYNWQLYRGLAGGGRDINKYFYNIVIWFILLRQLLLSQCSDILWVTSKTDKEYDGFVFLSFLYLIPPDRRQKFIQNIWKW